MKKKLSKYEIIFKSPILQLLFFCFSFAINKTEAQVQFDMQKWTGAWGSDGHINTGDLNGDGKTDVFMWKDAIKTWTVNISNGTGFTMQAWPGWGTTSKVYTGFLNNDRKTDVFFWDEMEKVWRINLSTGTGFEKTTWTGAWGSDGPINVGDLNKDKKTDVFMWRDSDKSWMVNLSTGSGFTMQRWTGAWGSDGPIIVGDLNGDGKTDVFMWRKSDNSWTVNLSTGTGFNMQRWTGAWGSDGPINVGDLNGDGKTDVFMWRQSDNSWTVNLSTGTGFNMQRWTGAWGSDGPIKVGDLNGDKKTDVLMWRRSDNSWTVNISTGTGFNMFRLTGAWGSDGPINVGDLNGDGKTDVFMWRGADNSWTINLSTLAKASTNNSQPNTNIDSNKTSPPDNSTPTGNNQGILINSINIVDVKCVNDNDGSIEILASSGGGQLEYDWGGGWTLNNKRSSLGVGMYSVNIRNNTGNTITVSPTIKSESDFTNISIQVLKKPSTSSSTDGEIKAIPNGTSGPYNYAWSFAPSPNSNLLTNIKAGNYTVSISDSKGCKLTQSIALFPISSLPPIPPGECPSFNDIMYGNKVFPYVYWVSMDVQGLQSFLNSTGGLVIGSKLCAANRTITFNGVGSGEAIWYTLSENIKLPSLLYVRAFSHNQNNGTIENPGIYDSYINRPPYGPIGNILSELITLGLNLNNCDKLPPIPQTKFGDFVLNANMPNIYNGKKISVIFDLINEKIGNCSGLGLNNWVDEYYALISINSRSGITCRN